MIQPLRVLLRSAAHVLLLGGFVFTASVVTAAEPSVRVKLELVADGLTSPLSMATLPGGHRWIVDQIGQVRHVGPDGALSEKPVLDLGDKLSTLNKNSFDERGLLDLALHPDFETNQRFFVTYIAPRRAEAPEDWDCTWRLSEFKAPASPAEPIDPSTEYVVLEFDQPYFNHNGGRIAFGPDGLLYISVGDGGSANDQGRRGPHGNGQDTTTLLGKILRIDVGDEKPYGIPKDNPFANGGGGRPEIFAYGLRNAWGLSFDRGGKRELFAADVGQALFEEVNIIVRGGNYGWAFREGFKGFDASAPNESPAEPREKGLLGESFVDPVIVYRHPTPRRLPNEHGISITGGYVYRGKAFPKLEGHYVFGDWSRHWALPQGVLLVGWRNQEVSGVDGGWPITPITVVEPKDWKTYVVGFAEDNDGELYVLTNGSNGLTPGKGRVWKILPAE